MSNHKTPVKTLKEIARNTRRMFALAWQTDARITFLYYLSSSVGAMVPLAIAWILKILIDALQTTQQLHNPSIPIIVVIVLAARYLITFADGIIYYGFNQSYLDYLFRYKLQNEISGRFHKKIADLDIAYFEDPRAQDLIAKTRETMLWRVPDFMRVFSYLAYNLIAMAAAFVVLLPYGIWIPFVVTILTMPRLFLQAKYGAIQWFIYGSGAPQVKKLWYLTYMLQEPVTVRETRISQSAGKLIKKLKDIQEHLYNLNKKTLDRYIRSLTIPPIVQAVAIFTIAWHFLPSVAAGQMSIGDFTLLIAMLEQLGGRAASASSHFAQIYEDNLYANDYFELLSLPPLIPAPKNPVILDSQEPPTIEFKNVSFSYPGTNKKVLDNVSFVIPSGTSLAIVGHNGAGKTTITKLLCRFYDASEGAILINGIDLRELDLKSWYSHMGTLMQEFVKYHFSVRDNITMNSSGLIDEEAMRQAAKKSGAAEFIEKLDNGYDQILGKEFEDGVELSGGQWQKLAIARAFYDAPPVLILDEPTSAIDAAAEYEIFQNLEQHYKNRTLILVSHRFSTVRNADKIIVIEDGKLVENGTHQLLMEQKGSYSTLFSIQAKGYQ